MRLFVAICLPEEIRKGIVEVQNTLGGLGDMKLVERENIHITLLFLGEVKSPESAISALEKVRAPPFGVSMKGVGVFPNEGFAKVVWAGVENGGDRITELSKMVGDALKTKDDRFHPHATIARVRTLRKQQFLEFLKGTKDIGFGAFRVESFELMESKLTPRGPEYSVVKGFPLL